MCKNHAYQSPPPSCYKLPNITCLKERGYRSSKYIKIYKTTTFKIKSMYKTNENLNWTKHELKNSDKKSMSTYLPTDARWRRNTAQGLTDAWVIE